MSIIFFGFLIIVLFFFGYATSADLPNIASTSEVLFSSLIFLVRINLPSLKIVTLLQTESIDSKK